METELRDLLAYYGQAADSESKPEDFFGLVMSFSIALQARLPLKTHFSGVSDRRPSVHRKPP